MRFLRFREGDFIETSEGLIFDVKGLTHPPNKVIAFVRYVPSSEGYRERYGCRYLKVYDLNDRFNFLKKQFPHYLSFDPIIGEEIIEVPLDRITQHYQPINKVIELRSKSPLNFLEKKALKFIDRISTVIQMPQDSIGISGSLLVSLSSSTSDLDLIVYGIDNAQKVDHALTNLLDKEEDFKKYTVNNLKLRYKARSISSGIKWEEYMFHEQRKSFQGFFDKTEFYVRYIKDWSEVQEVYGDRVFIPMGRAKISGIITNDSDSLFTPCNYGIEDVKVLEGIAAKPIVGISSFRGRFCRQALVGEHVLAYGKLEKIIQNKINSWYRLVLGNTPNDFLVTVK